MAANRDYEPMRIQIKLFELAVKDAIDENPVEQFASEEDPTAECKEWIQAATNPYNQLRDLINGVLIRPPQGVDEAEIN